MKRLAKKTDAMYNQVSQILLSGVYARSAGGGQSKSSCIKVFGVYFSRNNCSNANYCSCCCCNNWYY